MSVSAQEAYQELQKIGDNINMLLRQTSANGEADAKVEYEDSDDGRMFRYEIHQILEKLKKARADIVYLDLPIVREGYLTKNSRSRYELDGHEFTSGSGIEILINDDYDDDPNKKMWYITRIEHDGNDYYAVDNKEINLNGIKARMRAHLW